MKKNTILYILLAFLILVNGFFLFNHLNRPDKRGDKGNPNSFISKELKFNATQKESYTKLFDEHRSVMIEFDRQLKIDKDTFFNAIGSSNVNTKTIDSLASVVAIIEKKKDLELFNHFKQIYDICDESQKKDFQTIIKKALGNNSNKRRPPPKRRD